MLLLQNKYREEEPGGRGIEEMGVGHSCVIEPRALEIQGFTALTRPADFETLPDFSQTLLDPERRNEEADMPIPGCHEASPNRDCPRFGAGRTMNLLYNRQRKTRLHARSSRYPVAESPMVSARFKTDSNNASFGAECVTPPGLEPGRLVGSAF